MSRSVQQNILSVLPDGTVNAVFPGGVEMPTNPGTGSITPKGRVSWRRPDTKAIRGLIATFDEGPDNSLLLQAGPEGTGQGVNAKINIRYRAPFGVGNITAGLPSASAAGIDESVNIINSLGRSDFLQGAILRGGSGPADLINPWSPGVISFNTGSGGPGPTGPRGGTCIVGVQSSAYVLAGGAYGQYHLYLDGVFVGYNRMMFNTPNLHLTMPWAIGQVSSLAPGNHTLQLVSQGNLVVDAGDAISWFCVG